MPEILFLPTGLTANRPPLLADAGDVAARRVDAAREVAVEEPQPERVAGPRRVLAGHAGVAELGDVVRDPPRAVRSLS